MSTWYVYELVEQDPPKNFSLADILRGMRAFEKEYKLEYHPVPHIALWAWELELEEKSRRRSSRGSQREAPPAPKRRFAFAFSAKDEILFSNKLLSKKHQIYMTKALHCQKLEQKPRLTNGTPTNLLMLYKQAKVENPGVLELQYQEKLFETVEQLGIGKPLTTEVQEPSDKQKQLCLRLGSFPEKIPQIKKVEVEVRNIPVNTANPNLKDYRIEEIGLEVCSPSVLHLYKNLAEHGIIKDLPPWIMKMRTDGVTRCSAHYS